MTFHELFGRFYTVEYSRKTLRFCGNLRRFLTILRDQCGTTAVQFSRRIHLLHLAERLPLALLLLVMEIDPHGQFRGLMTSEVLYLFQIQSVLKAARQEEDTEQEQKKVNTASRLQYSSPKEPVQENALISNERNQGARCFYNLNSGIIHHYI